MDNTYPPHRYQDGRLVPANALQPAVDFDPEEQSNTHNQTPAGSGSLAIPPNDLILRSNTSDTSNTKQARANVPAIDHVIYRPPVRKIPDGSTTNSQRWSPYPGSPALASQAASHQGSDRLSPRTHLAAAQSDRRDTESMSPLSYPLQYHAQSSPAMQFGRQSARLTGLSLEDLTNKNLALRPMTPEGETTQRSDGRSGIRFHNPFQPRATAGDFPVRDTQDDGRSMSSNVAPIFSGGLAASVSRQQDQRQAKRLVAKITDRIFHNNVQEYMKQAQSAGAPTLPPPTLLSYFKTEAHKAALVQVGRSQDDRPARQPNAPRLMQTLSQSSPAMDPLAALKPSPSPSAAPVVISQFRNVHRRLISAVVPNSQTPQVHTPQVKHQSLPSLSTTMQAHVPAQAPKGPADVGSADGSTQPEVPQALSAPAKDDAIKMQALKTQLLASINALNTVFDQRDVTDPAFTMQYIEVQQQVESAMYAYLAANTRLDLLSKHLWTLPYDQLVHLVRAVSAQFKKLMKFMVNATRLALRTIKDEEVKWVVISKSATKFYHGFSAVKAGLAERDSQKDDGQKTLVTAWDITREQLWLALRPLPDDQLSAASTVERLAAQKVVEAKLAVAQRQAEMEFDQAMAADYAGAAPPMNPAAAQFGDMRGGAQGMQEYHGAGQYQPFAFQNYHQAQQDNNVAMYGYNQGLQGNEGVDGYNGGFQGKAAMYGYNGTPQGNEGPQNYNEEPQDNDGAMRNTEGPQDNNEADGALQGEQASETSPE